VNFFSRSNRLTTPAAISQFLDDLPSGSDVSSDSSDEEDNPEDIDYLVHMRYRGIEAPPQPGLGMFRDSYKEAEFGEDGGDEVGGDGDVGGEARDDQTEEGDNQAGEDSDDEVLPDLDTSDMPARGEPSKKKPRQEKKTWTWAAGDLPPQEMPDNFVRPKGMENCKFPVDYFMKVFGYDTFEMLLEQTNIHRRDVNKKISVIGMGELRQVVGILFYMSVVSMPNMRLFWKKSMNNTAVSKVMTRDRFLEIVSALHMSNNHLQPARGDPGYDKLFKVRNLLNHLTENFKNSAEMEKILSVDEQMIPYKGTIQLKVYMKNKPSKWGIKIWALAGQSGYVHRFNIFGDNLINNESELGIGASGQTVLNMVSEVEPGTEVFFDNYFASPGLLLALKDMGLPAACTLRVNRTEKCPLKTEKELKKEGRGAMDSQVSTEGILIAKWFDNKEVTVGTNHYSVKPTSQVGYCLLDCYHTVHFYITTGISSFIQPDNYFLNLFLAGEEMGQVQEGVRPPPHPRRHQGLQ
jgi:hypothetical protein